MIKYNTFLGTFLLVIFIISGCASKPVAVETSFWDNTNQRIAVIVSELPTELGLFKEGGQGLLDIAINSAATKGVNEKLSNLDPTPFLGVRTKFVEKLSSKGFTVDAYKKLINIKGLPKREKKTGYSKLDLTTIFEETKADRVIMLQLNKYGAVRNYYGFIPLSDPQGLAVVEGMMINKGHKIEWNTSDSIIDSYIKEPVNGEWKQKPDYTNLINASKRALEKSQNVLLDRFFSQ